MQCALGRERRRGGTVELKHVVLKAARATRASKGKLWIRHWFCGGEGPIDSVNECIVLFLVPSPSITHKLKIV